ncbi:hypothetical protein [Paenibacillus chitinolyticus]|uniref:hypothetical protein n=1 Tax=Paenibacillus chitinolyticus TaxID=79263 RepID=UPI003D071187
MKMKRKYIMSFLIINLFTVTSIGYAEEAYWDKGRDYATKICFNSSCDSSNSYNGWSTVVLSTGAIYNGLTGLERTRIWSRIGTLRKIYPDDRWIFDVERAEVTMRATGANSSAMVFSGTSPDTITKKYEIPSLVYTIYGFFNKYTGIAKDIIAATGVLTVQSGTESKNIVGGKTVVWYSPKVADIDLNNNIDWYDAEAQLGSNTSYNPGATARFSFSLNPGVKNFPVEATGRIRYAIGVPNYPYPGYSYSYYWTNGPQVPHTIN